MQNIYHQQLYCPIMPIYGQWMQNPRVASIPPTHVCAVNPMYMSYNMYSGYSVHIGYNGYMEVVPMMVVPQHHVQFAVPAVYSVSPEQYWHAALDLAPVQGYSEDGGLSEDLMSEDGSAEVVDCDSAQHQDQSTADVFIETTETPSFQPTSPEPCSIKTDSPVQSPVPPVQTFLEAMCKKEAEPDGRMEAFRKKNVALELRCKSCSLGTAVEVRNSTTVAKTKTLSPRHTSPEPQSSKTETPVDSLVLPVQSFMNAKPEKEAELDLRIEAIRKRNKAVELRHKEVQEDKNKADEKERLVSTSSGVRKSLNPLDVPQVQAQDEMVICRKPEKQRHASEEKKAGEEEYQLWRKKRD